jgi:hypothetical protein
MGVRDAGLLALAIGSGMTALIGPALMLVGLHRAYVGERRRANRNATERVIATET